MNPDDPQSVDDLKDFLVLAMKIEHATIPPYLTALYSIKPGTNQDVQNILRIIVVEEMLHLTFAANLLNAIGGRPDLNLKGFVPTYPTGLPGGTGDFQISLLPFTPDALRTFLMIERPAMAPDAGQILVRHTVQAGASMLAVHPRHPDRRYYSIGEFYSAVERGFIALEQDAQRQNKTIFIGDPNLQVGTEQFYSGGGRLFKVTNLQRACSAIQKVIQQGEGETRKIRDDQGELAHYYRFDQIKKEAYYQPMDLPDHPTGPTFKMDWSSVYPVAQDVKLAQLSVGSELYQAAVAFNRRYAEFLEVLTKAYNGEPTLLETRAVPIMFTIRNLMNELIRNPLPEGGGRHAGPTFELYAPNMVGRRS